jgi:hypothetical protein
MKAVKRRRAEKSKQEEAEYKHLLARRLKEKKQKHKEEVKRRHSFSISEHPKPCGSKEIPVSELLDKHERKEKQRCKQQRLKQRQLQHKQ